MQVQCNARSQRRDGLALDRRRGDAPHRSRGGLALFLLAAAVPLPLAAQSGAPLAAQGGARIGTDSTVTLDEAIRLSLDASPAAVAAAAGVSSARAGVLQARGAFLPTLTLGSTYTNSSNERFDQSTGRLVSESYTSQATASYDVFTGGRRFAQHRAASAQLTAADASYRAERYRTMLETTQVYYDAAAAGDILAAARGRLERARQQLEFARTRLDVGTATRSDELRAEIEVGNAELAVVDAGTALRAAELELGRRIGVAAAVHAAPGSLPETAPSLPSTETLVARARRSAPDIVAARATLRSRHADRLAAYTPYLPSLRLTGGYDWFSFQFPPNQQSWSFRLSASLPLFNGFQREASVQRAAALERSAEATNRDATLAVRAQVEAAVDAIAAARRRIEISGRGLALAREDLRVQEERYQLGASTILDLQASQVALADAEVQTVRERQALGTAVARLQSILGSSISEEEQDRE